MNHDERTYLAIILPFLSNTIVVKYTRKSPIAQVVFAKQYFSTTVAVTYILLFWAAQDNFVSI